MCGFYMPIVLHDKSTETSCTVTKVGNFMLISPSAHILNNSRVVTPEQKYMHF